MDKEQIWSLIERALDEDVGQGDVASMWALPSNAIARGCIVAREAGVLAGIEVAQAVFERVNALIAFSPRHVDGARISAEDELAAVVGPATSVFAAERTALNFVGRMSGIATLTRRFVEAVQGTNAVILSTRKTAPGLRTIDQWAVRLGGGGTHRARLDETVFIRSGHLAIAGGIAAAMERVRQRATGLQVVVEAENWAQLDEALPLEPDRIMLTGMPAQDIVDAVKWVAGRLPLEVSGPITLDNVRAIAETGVDYISVPALTQCAPDLRIGLVIDAP